MATSSARTVARGNGPLRSRLRQRVGRGRAAGGAPSCATSQRVVFRSFMPALDARRRGRVQPLGLVVDSQARTNGAIYQLMPELLRQAINEAVETAKEFCGADAPGFVNGILAAALRDHQSAGA